MVLYVALLLLNLLGMGYLFYIKEKQSQVNREYLSNAIIVNAVVEILRKEVEDLTNKIAELNSDIEKLKK